MASGRTLAPLPGAQLDPLHPLTRGLLGCWLLNDQGGAAFNLADPRLGAGSLTGGAVWGAGGVHFPDSSATIANNDNVVQCGSSTIFQLQDFTLRVRCVRYGTATFHALMALGVSVGNPNNAGVILRFNETSQVLSGLASVANAFEAVSSTDTFGSTGVLYDCAMTKRGTAVALYVNGRSVASGTFSSATVDYTSGTATHTSIGAYFSAASLLFNVGFHGRISLAQVWNYALTAPQVQQAMADPFGLVLFPIRRSHFFVAPAAGDAVPQAWMQYRARRVA